MKTFQIIALSTLVPSIIMWGFPDLFKNVRWLYFVNMGYSGVCVIGCILYEVYFKEKK